MNNSTNSDAFFHESRLTNLPSILRGIASDEQIHTVFDLTAITDAATEIERLRIQHTLHQHAVAYYLTDTIADPFDRQRVALSRFGKAVAHLCATEPDQPPTRSPDTDR